MTPADTLATQWPRIAELAEQAGMPQTVEWRAPLAAACRTLEHYGYRFLGDATDLAVSLEFDNARRETITVDINGPAATGHVRFEGVTLAAWRIDGKVAR